MPLAERDVNSQQHQHQSSTRGKRFAAAGHENAAPSSHAAACAKATPQRFLAPTKASSAKTTPSPIGERTRPLAPSGRSTPHSQAQLSRLPRRSPATPTISPPISKWNTASVNPSACAAVPVRGNLQISPDPRQACDAADEQFLISIESSPAIRPPDRQDKPLPPRPIASLTYAPSPSKDSRGLIDASEKPLRLSVGGSECDWPTLIPNSQSTPLLGASFSPSTISHDEMSPKRLSADAASFLRAAAEPDVHNDVQQSSASLEATDEGMPDCTSTVIDKNATGDKPSERAAISGGDVTNDEIVAYPSGHQTQTISRPPRKSSLANRLSNINFIERSQSSCAKAPDFVNFAQGDAAASRPHSPSPASFSRPRPTSISHPSRVIAATTAVTVTPVKSRNTASRIPLPDQKKATLVDIKARRPSNIPTPKFEKGLSFGGRRIDSPDPLKVLDHGIKRRQLRRADTNGSNSTSSTAPTRFLSHYTSPVDRSKANTPDSTMGTTSEDEEEITTPSDKSSHFVKHGYKPKYTHRSSADHYESGMPKVYDDTEVVLGRPPPSNSPFTGPLQTIPSQSLLPLQAMSCHNSINEDSHPKVVVKPTEFMAIAKRLSVLEDAQNLFSDHRPDRQSMIDGTAKSELVEILREAEHEDALISQSGAVGLDHETKLEITHTLSLLEGKAEPSDCNVNLEHLSHMFGRLKSGFEKAPKSVAFVEDAHAAERFLIRPESTASDMVEQDIQQKSGKRPDTSLTPSHDDDTVSQHSKSKTVASKWSNSTASARNTFGFDFEGIPPGPPPKDFPSGFPRSIGYPSRTPGKAHQLLGTDERSIKSGRSIARRESSPTLGPRVPGSISAARQKARDATGRRADKVSDTRLEKMPTPNTKAFSLSAEPPRGRLTSAEKPTHSSLAKLPRSRSKSRYVLDKINGLFSGKRDRRNSELPPVPPVKDKLKNANQADAVSSRESRISLISTPVLNAVRIPPLTKMPTVSPPVDSAHPALRSAPSLASVAPSAMTAGSNADYEGRRSLQTLSEKLLGRAQKEGDPAKKERLLNFAKVLNDSLISAREAQISAETAQTAARSAQLSYEMTMKSVAMLQRLATSMNRR